MLLRLALIIISCDIYMGFCFYADIYRNKETITGDGVLSKLNGTPIYVLRNDWKSIITILAGLVRNDILSLLNCILMLRIKKATFLKYFCY